MRATWMRSLVISLLLGAFTLSCSATEEEDPNLTRVKAYLSQCDVNLQAGNYAHARNAAYNVVTSPKLMSINDVAVDRAIFCYTTANTLHQVNELTTSLANLVTSVVGLIGGDGFKLGASAALQQLALDYREGRFDPQASIISTVIGGFTSPIRKMLEENQKLMEIMIKRGRYNYYIAHVPVKVAGAQILDAGGKVDMGEVYLLYGITRALQGLFNLGDSQDYTFTLKLLDYIGVEDNPLMQFGEGPEKLAPAILNAVAVLMGTSPNFLKLDSRIGEASMQAAGEGFADGFEGLLKGIKHMKEKRRGDQTGYVVEYRREALSASDEDVLVLNWVWNQGANPIFIVDVTGFSGMKIPLSEDILESLATIRDDIALVEGKDTSLNHDVFPIVALFVSVLLNTGAFDALLNLVLDSADGSMREQIDQVLNIVKGNRNLITGALQALVPVNVLFDFGEAFRNPKGLRELFPAWTQPAPGEKNISKFVHATLVYSYECKDGHDPMKNGSILCKEAEDRGHFQKEGEDEPYIVTYYADDDDEFKIPLELDTGLTWTNYIGNDNFGPTWNSHIDDTGEMGEDGKASAFPYIGFKDPTFGGILYLDVATIQNDKIAPTKSGFEPATLKTLNAAIAEIFEQIQGFL